MKTRLLSTLLFVAILGFILSCASTPLPELTAEHENIIGTNWVTVVVNSNFRGTLEFIDRYICISTLDGKQTRLRYTVKDNKIIFGNNVLIYEIRKDELYIAGLLSYRKM